MIKVADFFRTRWRAIVLIAATYFYFLIFAQFGFLHRITETVGDAYWNLVLGAMALAGVCGALWTAMRFRSELGTRWLMIGFVGCAAGAFFAVIGTHLFVFVWSALLSGFSLALLTVAMVGVVATQFPSKHVGLLCGLGTGGAYFLSNVPWVFEASPLGHCLLAIVACTVGGGVLRSPVHPAPEQVIGVASSSRAMRKMLLGQVLVFLVLIWTDSAAFTQIQETADLKATSWSGGAHLWAIAAVHFIAAVLGGVLMDRGRSRLLYGLTFVGLMAGFLLLEHHRLGVLPVLLYAASVSCYSTALVAFALIQASELRVVFSAGVVFAVSGWIGSAMGVGMVNDLGHVPSCFWAVAAAVGLSGLLLIGRRVHI